MPENKYTEDKTHEGEQKRNNIKYRQQLKGKDIEEDNTSTNQGSIVTDKGEKDEGVKTGLERPGTHSPS